MKKRLLFLSAWVLLFIFLKFFGVFQSLELALYDHYWQVVPREQPDPNLVIVGIDEDDLRYFGQWPPSNDQLADLIGAVEAQNPAVIGLDIFRDLGVSGQLEEVFRHSQKLIGIGQHNNGVNFPAILRQRKRVGDVTVVNEPDHEYLRRLFLYSLTDGSEDSEIGNLSLMLVFDYLKTKNQGRIGTNQKTGELTINERTVPDLHRLDGGYSLRKMSGSQLLIRWRKGNYDPNRWEQSFKVVTVKNIKEGQIDPKLFTGKIVLIGYRALSVKDQFITPVGLRYGVDVVAQATSQVRSYIEDNRPFFWFLPEWAEYGLLIGGVGLAYSHKRFSRFESVWREGWVHGGIALLVLAGLYYSGLFCFSKGLWIPLAQVIIAYAVSLWLFLLVGYINHIHWQNLRQERIISEKTADLESSNRQLRSAQERRILEEKQLFVGLLTTQLTHTLQNYVVTLKMSTRFLKRVFRDSQTASHYATNQLKALQESVENQSQTLDNISDLMGNLKATFRGELKSDHCFAVADVIEQVVSQYRRNYPTLRLVTDLDNLGEIKHNRLIFEQILRNLLENAKDALEAKETDSGVVANGASSVITLTSRQDEQMLFLSIQDNGVGIAPEHLSQIFEPHFTTKSKGWGWGLYFVYQNVLTMGGKVQVFSTVGEGTSFELTFPLS